MPDNQTNLPNELTAIRSAWPWAARPIGLALDGSFQLNWRPNSTTSIFTTANDSFLPQHTCRFWPLALRFEVRSRSAGACYPVYEELNPVAICVVCYGVWTVKSNDKGF